MNARTCDLGGDYRYDRNGRHVYNPPCTNPATHRYRSAGMADEHWGHRCAEHAEWLDRSVCDVEPLAAEVRP